MSERTATRIVEERSRGGSPRPSRPFGGVARVARRGPAALRRDRQDVVVEAADRRPDDLDRAAAQRVHGTPRRRELLVDREALPGDDAAARTEQRETQLD